MEAEDELCAKFEAELASIAALDHLYYTNPSPTSAERREYAARQVQLGEMRSRFYEEFRSCRQVAVSPSTAAVDPSSADRIRSKDFRWASSDAEAIPSPCL